MIDQERIDRLRKDCLTSLRLQMEAAAEGHAWVVTNRVMQCTELLELLAAAEAGLPHLAAFVEAKRSQVAAVAKIKEEDGE